MTRLALLAVLILAITTLSVRAQDTQLTGDWAVDDMNMGAGQTVSFRADGMYEYKIWQILPGTRRIAQAEEGSYAVQGSRLTLYPRSGGAQTYAWQLTEDPHVGSQVLRLYDAAGREWAFYAQSSQRATGQVSSSTPGNCRAQCGEAFSNCNIAGSPYSYCSDQVEACTASCR